MNYKSQVSKETQFISDEAVEPAAASSIDCRLGRIVSNVSNLSIRIDTLAERLDPVLAATVPETAGVNGTGQSLSCKLDGVLAAIDDGLASKIAKLESVIDRIRL